MGDEESKIEIDFEGSSDIDIALSIIEGICADAKRKIESNPIWSDDESVTDIAGSRLHRIAHHILLEIGEE